MHILLCGSFDACERDQWLRVLQAQIPDAHWHLDRDEAAERIEVAVVANPPPGSLRGLPGLRLIQSLWAGVDRLMADDSLPAGVPVARMVDPYMSAAMAETAVWASLSLHRGFFAYQRQQREGLWRQLEQRRACDVRIGVLGMGQLGRRAARQLAALGYRVTGWSQRTAAAEPGIDTCSTDQALQELLPQCDILINLLPLTPATRGLLNRQLFAAMRRGASLVNLARGAHLIEQDLLQALDDGQLGHAVLDAFAEEPLPAGHPFWQHPQITLLPHVAALTDMRSAAEAVAANLQALVRGEPLSYLVDRQRGY
ncbi:glyoxylate/hydroxypyruvate reductase A [Stutzerimonas nosocomialis]|uniref:2-hydroxyacid dehydrogenase n=1 Tax=Stutzerimonas nosocomialis TaxID=1056496 RepID=UPI00110894AA|nr:glyoxylate/hydroxypyruvate reductase A [Stutzerimonas nosocomialis]TLX57076.1 glyoxylate/hydroxypyruvate reductase A [Stutzerimonas nosocomialis]